MNEEPKDTQTAPENEAAQENTVATLVAEETVENAEAVTERANTQKISKQMKIAGLIVATAVIVVAGILIVLNRSGGPVSGASAATVIATVNGAEITQAHLDERLQQIESAAALQGRQGITDDPAIRQQIVDELVNMELLGQLALAAGLTVEDTEIDAEITTLVGLFGGKQELEDQLALLNITHEQLRKNIADELLVKKYVDESTDADELTATEEEVRAVYDQTVTAQEDAPSFEELRPFLEQQLMQQKTAAVLQSFIDELRRAADIEINE